MNNSSKPNANFRRDQIPVWINVLTGLIIAILAFQSYATYFNPSMQYPGIDLAAKDGQLAMATLAGRNVVMLLLTLLALRSQNAMFMTYAFIMSLIREVQDMFIVPYFQGFTTMAGISTFATFLIVFVIPYILAIRKLRSLAALPD